MAQITLDVPDAVAGRVTDAVAVKFDYPNSKLQNETKSQFLKRMISLYVREWVKDGERIAIENSHRADVDALTADVDSKIVIS